jgi:hypothetical protein
VREQLIDDLRDAAKAGATVHHINITAFADLDLFDFSQAAAMIAAGKTAMDTYLNAPKPNQINPLPNASAQLARPLPRGGRLLKH